MEKKLASWEGVMCYSAGHRQPTSAEEHGEPRWLRHQATTWASHCELEFPQRDQGELRHQRSEGQGRVEKKYGF